MGLETVSFVEESELGFLSGWSDDCAIAMETKAVKETTATEPQKTKSFVFIQITTKAYFKSALYFRPIATLGQGRVWCAGSFRQVEVLDPLWRRPSVGLGAR